MNITLAKKNRCVKKELKYKIIEAFFSKSYHFPYLLLATDRTTINRYVYPFTNLSAQTNIGLRQICGNAI